MNIVDSRASSRTRVSWRLRILEPNGTFYEARVSDISDLGLGAYCERSFLVGATLTLAIAIPQRGASPFSVHTCQGKVIFASFTADGCRLGFQFLAPEETFTEAVRQALANRG